ncbi:tetratricopeptide repeat protein [Kibdelosporangium philippinense]|uniref:Tetratricopeptide repeat protein n=1 Tax=Kibdelosporangium philippinense TaxID=211113 RepID=A0ABS8ZY09_9PSEU|nr:tetratricopeptide repeat protein [Kibdelosporangium philippinense]MCE7010902.1 tetratricopeptide repeat protein [Kibdelosporangium philippinense]
MPVLRDIVLRIHREHPELTAKHRYAIRTYLPDLADSVPETLTDVASWEERTRFQDGVIRRAAHGIAELLNSYVDLTGPLTLTVDNQELQAVLTRRSPLVTVLSGVSALPQPTEEAVRSYISFGDFEIAAALAKHVVTQDPVEDRRIRLLHAFSVRSTDPELSEQILLEVQEKYADPATLMATNYSLAMLHTTFHARPDLSRAHSLARKAVELADELSDPFARSFQRNGLALVELRFGRPEAALDLTTEALGILGTELPDSALEHHAIVHLNRARILQALGRLDEALQDFDAAVARDPYFPEYHYYRAGCVQLLGDAEGAIAGYERAMALSAPWPEPYYSRGDLRAARGDIQGALEDFGYVLELDPDHLDARVNRAALLAELDDYDAAMADVEHGLKLAPDNAHLLCTKGLLMMDDMEAARELFTRALRGDPNLTPALVNSAILDYDGGNFPAAIEKLTRALEITPQDADIWLNRSVALQAAGRLDEAASDYRNAIELAATSAQTAEQ